MLGSSNTRTANNQKAVVYASLIWLLNPMVCVISTRGSSEGLLGAMVISFLWAAYARRYVLAGVLAGLAVHFKIYPIIYVPTVLWAVGPPSIFAWNRARVQFALASAASFCALTGVMYSIYGYPFLHDSYLHHLSRVDHRHNFSPYATLLYMGYAPGSESVHAEALAFVPQLLLSGVLVPLAFARRDLAKTMFVQTLVFVTFNKVCTSQYFLWYMVLLPFFMPLRWGLLKTALAAGLWLGAQTAWINYGYRLEFLGESTFYPALFACTLFFFGVNCWIVGLFIDEI